jgi:predicted nucleic acid-binding protein
MPDKVVDASVLGAIVFEEPQARTALAILGDDSIHAPFLLAFELASIARTKIVRHPEQRDSILLAPGLGLRMNIHWVDISQVGVVQLALDVGLSTYDAAYLFLARSLNLPLVTFDRRLRDAI